MPNKKKKISTINIMPSWRDLWRMCKDGQFPSIFEELVKPCEFVDQINASLEKGATVKIWKDENGVTHFDDGLGESNA